jgi:hypothetical protein
LARPSKMPSPLVSLDAFDALAASGLGELAACTYQPMPAASAASSGTVARRIPRREDAADIEVGMTLAQ